MSTTQNSINQLLNSDLALKVFIKNKSGGPTSNYTSSNNVWGSKWIDVPTHLDTMIGFVPGMPIKTNKLDESITFLVLQKYTQTETNEITNALNLNLENIKSPNIKFGSSGTIIVNGKKYLNRSNPTSGGQTGDVFKDYSDSYYNGNILSWDSKKYLVKT